MHIPAVSDNRKITMLYAVGFMLRVLYPSSHSAVCGDINPIAYDL